MKELTRIGWEASDWEDLRDAKAYFKTLNFKDNPRELYTLRNMMIAGLNSQVGFDRFWEEELEQDKLDQEASHNWRTMEENTDRETANEMLWMLIVVHHARFWKHDETITELALSQSLCPAHFVDYAICFDDDDPVCAMIRFIHPNHDT